MFHFFLSLFIFSIPFFPKRQRYSIDTWQRSACASRGPEHLLPGGTLPHTAGGARRVAGDSVVRPPSPSPLLSPRIRRWPYHMACAVTVFIPSCSRLDDRRVCVRVLVKNISFSSLFRFRSDRSSFADQFVVRSPVFCSVIEFFHVSLQAKNNIYAHTTAAIC